MKGDARSLTQGVIFIAAKVSFTGHTSEVLFHGACREKYDYWKTNCYSLYITSNVVDIFLFFFFSNVVDIFLFLSDSDLVPTLLSSGSKTVFSH